MYYTLGRVTRYPLLLYRTRVVKLGRKGILYCYSADI